MRAVEREETVFMDSVHPVFILPFICGCRFRGLRKRHEKPLFLYRLDFLHRRDRLQFAVDRGRLAANQAQFFFRATQGMLLIIELDNILDSDDIIPAQFLFDKREEADAAEASAEVRQFACANWPCRGQ
jgi:hypothetical protein